MQYCAQCHGANLEGAPNWRQRLPDSSGHTWHHSDALLIKIVAAGGQAVYGNVMSKSNMLAFKDRLAPEEIAAVLDFIKSKWGKDEREIPWWMTATGAEK